MAVALVFRAAVILAPVGWKLVQQLQGSDLARWDQTFNTLLGRDDLSDEEVSEQLSAHAGTMIVVTTFPGPFTLHLLQVKFGRDSGAGSPEDDAICTFHYAKVTGGVLVDPFTGADFDDIELHQDNFWGAVLARCSSHIKLREYRWFKVGPDVDAELGGQGRTGPPVRVVARNIVGAGYGLSPLPPQVAMSVTEHTADPKSWGRFYIPGLGTGSGAGTNLATDGRWSPDVLTVIADEANVLYDAAASAGTPIVVYSNAKSERPAAGGGTLPAIGARALTVDEIAIDDIPDVIRSRRYAQAHTRELRTVGA